MPEDFSSKSVCVYDEGQFQETAVRLARDFGKVYYFKPWKKSAPDRVNLSVGDGLDNVKRVRNFFDIVNKVDLFVFPDVYDGDLQLYLESKGHRVWGSRKAEELEFKRELFNDTVREVSLPVAPYQVVVGTEKLREYLESHDDQVIKVSVCRGDGETWTHEDIRVTRCKLDAMDYFYGPLRYYVRFVVQKKINSSREVAYDGISVDGQFTDGLLGYEIKNQCYVAAWKKYEDMAEEVRQVNEAFAPKLREMRFRSPWGTEIIIDDDGTPFFIDATCRKPDPPGPLEDEMIANISQIMWHGANGEFVQAEAAAPFGVQINFYANWGDLAWLPILIPEEQRQWIKLGTACKVDGVYYCIQSEGNEKYPWMREQLGCAVGLGDTIEEAIEKATQAADSIKGVCLEICKEPLAEALLRIQEGEKHGIDFAEEVPEPSAILES